MDRNTRWRLTPSDAFTRREWDGESIVYDERNGATHLLGTGATSLLKALSEARSPMTAEALLVAALGPQSNVDVSDGSGVEAAIGELARSGLIECLPP